MRIEISIATDIAWDKPTTSRIKREIRIALKEFGRQFPGIEFIIHQKGIHWHSPNIPSKPTEEIFKDFLENLETSIPTMSSREFILGFTGKNIPKPKRWYLPPGTARLSGNHAVFSARESIEWWLIILHELGHLMGALHSKEGIMGPYENKNSEFDPKNIERIQERIAKL